MALQLKSTWQATAKEAAALLLRKDSLVCAYQTRNHNSQNMYLERTLAKLKGTFSFGYAIYGEYKSFW